MERRTVTVHQNHGRGKVESARCQNTNGSVRVEGLARRHPRRIIVITPTGQNQDRKKRHGHDPGHAYDRHASLKQEKYKSSKNPPYFVFKLSRRLKKKTKYLVLDTTPKRNFLISFPYNLIKSPKCRLTNFMNVRA